MNKTKVYIVFAERDGFQREVVWQWGGVFLKEMCQRGGFFLKEWFFDASVHEGILPHLFVLIRSPLIQGRGLDRGFWTARCISMWRFLFEGDIPWLFVLIRSPLQSF